MVLAKRNCGHNEVPFRYPKYCLKGEADLDNSVFTGILGNGRDFNDNSFKDVLK